MKNNRNYRPAGRDKTRPEASRRPARPQSRPQEEESVRGMQREDIVIGRNGVIELLKSGRAVESILVTGGETQGSIVKILAMAKEQGIPVKETSPAKLDNMCGHQNHQGVIAGAHGVIIPKRGSVGLTVTVAKTSAGAVEHLPVVRVSNLAATVDQLKKDGVWVYGTDMEGQCWCEIDYTGPVALIVGSEGKGMSRLLTDKCDFIASLPMYGEINSLNASVAAGIVMYEIARQRAGIKAR